MTWQIWAAGMTFLLGVEVAFLVGAMMTFFTFFLFLLSFSGYRILLFKLSENTICSGADVFYLTTRFKKN